MMHQHSPHGSTSLLDDLEKALSPPTHLVLDAVRAEASRHGFSLYLVGGSVRDLLLGTPINDLDFVVEGDALELAREVGRHLGAQLVTHSRFGTATIKLDGCQYDVATARSEVYSRPGALPTVSPSRIEDDLRRRDFTINAMALSLAAPEAGRLLDPHGGRSDLERSLIRVLHANSFADDPTRLLRAVRYEQRLGFRLEEEALALINQAVVESRLDSVSGDRIRRELGLILKEPHPHRPLERAEELSLLEAISPGLGKNRCVEEMGCAGEPELLAYLAALAYPLSTDQGEAFIQRLNMPGAWARVVRDAIALRLQEGDLAAPELTPSRVTPLLEGRAPVAIRAAGLLFASQLASQRLDRYLTSWRYVKPSLKGQDLDALGVPPGPLVGDILEKLRRARLDGEVSSRREEIDLAKGYLTNREGGSLHG